MNEFNKVLKEETESARDELAMLHLDEEAGGPPIEGAARPLVIRVGELGVITTATVSIIGRSANLALNYFKSPPAKQSRSQRNAFFAE